MDIKDKKIRGIVYKYVSPSNKVYIGTTINENARRSAFLRNGGVYAGPKINKAREKYGPKNFKYEIIFEVISYNLDEILNILDKKECEYIKLFNSIDNGYNMSTGGRDNHNLILSEESKQRKIKKAQKPILQYNLEGKFIKEWPSSKIASDTLNISSGNICQVLQGARYQTKGYIFKYKTSNYIPDKIEITPTRQQKKIILQLNPDETLVKEFSSIDEAAREAGVDRSTMSKYVNGHTNSLKYTGYIWRKKYV